LVAELGALKWAVFAGCCNVGATTYYYFERKKLKLLNKPYCLKNKKQIVQHVLNME
jgi:hypothetical protein